jgi:hypothetical protein
MTILAENLASAKVNAQLLIDQAAELVRGIYITPGSGQAMTYMRKSAQALAFKSAAYTGVVPPLVAAEVVATGLIPMLAADSILTTEAQWGAAEGVIETCRRTTKNAIAAAVDTNGVRAAVTVVSGYVGVDTFLTQYAIKLLSLL